MKKLIILGAGGNCLDILDTVYDINRYNERVVYECIGFLDDNKKLWGEEFYGTRVLGPLNDSLNYRNCFFVNGIGSAHNFWRKKDIIEKTGIPLEQFETIIHPSAKISGMAKIGRGTVVLPNVTVCSNAVVGNHVIILPNTAINHDTFIENYTCIASGVCISGDVTIGRSCYIGSNSSIKDGVYIDDFSLIGMGSVVIDDVKENSVVVGNPAKKLRNTI